MKVIFERPHPLSPSLIKSKIPLKTGRGGTKGGEFSAIGRSASGGKNKDFVYEL
jgi:hypothetical protein